VEALVVFDPNRSDPANTTKLGELSLDGVTIAVGRSNRSIPNFDARCRDDSTKVLVEVLAFSCNFRDRAILTGFIRSPDARRPIGFGSDFVGLVVDVGQHVKSVSSGDRVIGDNSYPKAALHDAPPGVPTNEASVRYLVLPECKVVKIPNSMPNSVAAGFSVAAQTCYGMIRKLGVKPGERCLVTGASSNTGLFSLSTLANRGVETYAVTTGLKDFKTLHVTGTIRVKQPINVTLTSNEIVKLLLRKHGGVDYVVDCFADVYAASVLPLLKPGGRYVTCGLFAQRGMEVLSGPSGTSWRDLLAFLIMNNITVYGNCLGSAADLHASLADYVQSGTCIPEDSVFGIDDALKFLIRSFLDPQRFGKAILQYRP
jgi:NADPH:quinone reductase-like Zn-dependent oxidoreductase